MPASLQPLLCAVALLTGLPAAQAAERRFDLVIAAGKIGEVCMALDAGTTLAWRFDASAPVDFNLHHHRDKQVVMPVERKALASDRAEHAIDASNEWCLMWSAPSDRRVTVVGAWSVKRR